MIVRVCYFIILLLSANFALAEPSKSQHPYVPPALEPWVTWIEEGKPEWRCASLKGRFECAWPGHLQVEISEHGGSFELSAELLKEDELPLPGSVELPPRNLQVTRKDGAPTSYTLHGSDERIAIKLPPGQFTIRGEFRWQNPPSELSIPETFALLTVKPDRQWRREGGLLRLGTSEQIAPSSPQVFITAMRRIRDGSPVLVDTAIDLQVSGEARPLQLGKVVLLGSTPVSIQSPLPFQLSADGSLSLQLLPGSHRVVIESVMAQPLLALQAPVPQVSEWPAEETWSWFPDTALRSVEVDGAQPISADLTNLPPDWRAGSTYVVTKGGAVQLKQLRRGEDHTTENILQLEREMWLDLDGSQLSSVDTISGTLAHHFRLNVLPEMALSRAELGGAPVLITTDPTSAHSGVEVRDQQIRLTAVSRISAEGPRSVVGWDAPVRSVRTTINLSPGWSLFYISGVDRVLTTWVGSWSLLDIFITLLLVFGTGRLFGRWFALLVGVVLLSNHGAFLEPRMILIHVLLGALVTVFRGEMAPRVRLLFDWYVRCSFALWTIEVLAFSKLQFTQFLFPQLEAGTRYRTAIQSLALGFDQNFLLWPFVFIAGLIVILLFQYAAGAHGLLQKLFRFGIFLVAIITVFAVVPGAVFLASSFRTVDFKRNMPSTHYENFRQSAPLSATQSDEYELEEQSPRSTSAKFEATKLAVVNKNVQSGSATPVWRWKSHSFFLSGPVAPEHQLRMYFLSPTTNRALALLRVLFSLLLVVALARALGIVAKLPLRHAAPLGLALLLCTPLQAHADDLPSPEMLQALETRLAEKLCTREECAQISSMEISVKENRATLVLTVMSEGSSAVALPGPLEELPIDRVLLNGTPTSALRRDDRGFVWVKIVHGASTVVASADLAGGGVKTIQFAQRPVSASFESDSWVVEGLQPSGAVQSTVRLIPRQQGKEVVLPRGETQIPSWLQVIRKIQIDEAPSLATVVRRIGDRTRPLVARVPLLPEERVISHFVATEGDNMVVPFSAGQESVEIQSSLPARRAFTLKASAEFGMSEEWWLACADVFTCNAAGILPKYSVAEGRHQYIWDPFPGEEVSIAVEPLTAVAGDHITVESVANSARWGSLVLEGAVRSRVRVTQQSPLGIMLPPGARITTATLNGNETRIIESEGKSEFLLTPGSHDISLSYTIPWQPSVRERFPQLSFTVPAHNVDLELQPGDQRWILWAGGLRWGPAVLFWGKLIFLAFFLGVLAHFGMLPISIGGAVLLSVGLASLSLVALVIPIGWLVTMQLAPFISARWKVGPPSVRVALFALLTLLALGAFFEVVRTGLVLSPPMLIVGNNSSAESLHWFIDHPGTSLPQPWVLSLAWWSYPLIMVIWSTWLVIGVVVRWIKLAIVTAKGLA